MTRSFLLLLAAGAVGLLPAGTGAPVTDPRRTADLLPAGLARRDAPLGDPDAALAASRELLARLGPGELERLLAARSDRAAPVLGTLGTALAAGGDATPALGAYLAAAGRARAERLAAAGPPWAAGDIEALVTLLLVDPARFVAEDAFRQRVLGLLPAAFDAGGAPELRDLVLYELNQLPAVTFAALEQLEHRWGAVPRRSAARRTPYQPGLLFADDLQDPLIASVYSLPSPFVTAAEARAFLAAVRAAAPERTLLVLTDLPLRQELAPFADEQGIRLLETYGRPYTPWPRDPFSLVRRPDGGVAALVRPDRQPQREADATLGLELIQNLPADLDRAWGEVTWSAAPVPFHNGQILLTADAAWVTLHGLEPRILALIGRERVPVESFSGDPGIERYLAAARRAAAELASVYGRPVRFAHPLPETGETAERTAVMLRIGGGAGFDLDSLLTLLPGEDRGRALVGDVTLGRDLLATLPAAELDALAAGYRLVGPGLSERLLAAQRSARAGALDGFLELLAAGMAGAGFEVDRLPLLLVPVALLEDREGLTHPDFLLTWNNVVVERRDGRLRAEGFASLLPTADRRVAATFAGAGARLDWFPPLVGSVVLNGGYRCASNHLRAPAARQPAAAPALR